MLTCQKHLFSLEPDVHYVNCAYMSPLLQSVEAAGLVGVRKKSQPYKITQQDFFSDVDILRGLFARVVNAEMAQRVAIVPSVSYGMAVVANNLPARAGQNIVVADAQFPSNVYPWRTLAQAKGISIKTVPYPTGERRGQRWNDAIIAAIDDQTALVALAHTHWSNGTKFDLKAIGAKAHAVGALFVIDGTQSVGALPIDVQDMGIDALVCGGYKSLMGPYGLGYAYFGAAFDDGKPVEENWIGRRDSENFGDLVNYKDAYQPYALRYDVGERSNFILIPMGIAALEQLLAWGADNIQQYCLSLTRDFIPQWRERGYWVEEEAWRGGQLFGIQLPTDVTPEALSAALKAHNVMVSVRGDFIRIAPNVYNDEADIAALTRALLSV